MRYIFIIVITIYVSVLFYNRFIKYPVRYVGYFYPDYTELEKWVESPPLKSLKECREWADTQADEYSDYIFAKFNKEYDYNFDYECGKDCYKGDPYLQGVKYTCHTSLD